MSVGASAVSRYVPIVERLNRSRLRWDVVGGRVAVASLSGGDDVRRTGT